MVTRMLLSLKRAAVRDIDQDWEISEKSETILDISGTSGIVRASVRYSNPVSHAKHGDVIPIPMEVIPMRDERYHV